VRTEGGRRRSEGHRRTSTGERSPDRGWPAAEEEQEAVPVLPPVSDVFNEGTLGSDKANRAQKFAVSGRERRAESREETLV